MVGEEQKGLRMHTVVSFVCDLCGTAYKSSLEAHKCERKPVIAAYNNGKYRWQDRYKAVWIVTICSSRVTPDHKRIYSVRIRESDNPGQDVRWADAPFEVPHDQIEPLPVEPA